MVILHTEFGLIWTIPWHDEKNLFLKFAIRETQKPQFSYERLKF